LDLPDDRFQKVYPIGNRPIILWILLTHFWGNDRKYMIIYGQYWEKSETNDGQIAKNLL
jgi:hypothetical protein